jgi:hypothetical protein
MGPLEGPLDQDKNPDLEDEVAEAEIQAEPAEWDDPCSCRWGTDWTCGDWIIKRKDPYCARHGGRDPDAERDARIDAGLTRDR